MDHKILSIQSYPVAPFGLARFHPLDWNFAYLSLQVTLFLNIFMYFVLAQMFILRHWAFQSISLCARIYGKAFKLGKSLLSGPKPRFLGIAPPLMYALWLNYQYGTSLRLLTYNMWISSTWCQWCASLRNK